MTGDRDHPQRDRAAGERDEILGAALRRLEIPPHQPGFHTSLRAKLGALPGPDTADRERRSAPRWAPRRGRARNPQRWMLGLAAAAAVALAAVVVPLSMSAPASAKAITRRAVSAARTGAGLPPFEMTVVTSTFPIGFQPEPPPARVAEHIEYAAPSRWRDRSVVTEPFREGTRTITRIRNGSMIATVAAGRVTIARAPGRAALPFSTSVAWRPAILRKLAAAESAGGCSPSVSLGGNGPLIDGRPTLILRVGPSPCPSGDIPQADGAATFWLDKKTFLVLRAVLHGPGNRLAETIKVTSLRYHSPFPAGTFRLPRPTGRRPTGRRPPTCPAVTSVPDLTALRSALASPPLIPASLPAGLRVGAIDSSSTTARCKITAFTITYRDSAGHPAVQLYEAPRASPAVRFPGRTVTIRAGLTGTLNSGTGIVILWWIQDGRYCSLQSGGVTAGVRLTRVPNAVLIQIAASLRR